MASIPVEVFLDEHLESEKRELSNLLKRLSSKEKKLKNGVKFGDIMCLKEALDAFKEEIPAIEKIVASIKPHLEKYNVTLYLQEGFDSIFRKSLAEENIPVRGEFPSYEIFPFTVEIDAKEGKVTINKKKVRGLRLKYLVDLIKAERDRFFKSTFRPEGFMRELAKAYDHLMEIHQLKSKSCTHLSPQPIPLQEVYEFLTPLPRWKRDYPLQIFGFHIYRLLKEEQSNPKATLIEQKGRLRRCTFGSVPGGSRSGISVIEESGRETIYGSVKFEEVEE